MTAWLIADVGLQLSHTDKTNGLIVKAKTLPELAKLCQVMSRFNQDEIYMHTQHDRAESMPKSLLVYFIKTNF